LANAAPLILLVGMHRSGTSLLGSLLPHLGVALPGPLIAGDQHNPEGYFERRDVVDLQEQLLIALDRFWAGPRGSEPLPRHWRSHPETRRVEQGLRELLQREAGRQAGPWAIKDPRSSVLLPLWRDLCRELGIPLRLVLAVRSPEAVVASVMARDERLAGMTWWRAQQLWWRFNAAVLRSQPAPGEPAPLVLHYETWFQEPQAQARSLAEALGLPQPGSAQLAAVQAAIRPDHRHQQPLPPGAPPLDPRIIRLHRWLQGQTRLSRVRRLAAGPLRPRRPWRQQCAHQLDWLWLLGSPLLPAGGLRAYRRRFLQGEGSGPLASPAWIARQRPQLLRHHRDPLAWYQRCGWRLGVSPHPLLQPQRLWAQLGLRQEPVALYRREAPRDDLQVHPRFDPVHYGRQCRQADALPRPTPLDHYLQEGWRRGLSPHPAVDPLWMRRRHGLPGEPLTALLLADADITDPGLTHPRGCLYGAALADPRCSGRLPGALVDLLQVWNARRLWPAERWLEPGAWQRPLPPFDLFGPEPPALFAAGLRPQPPLSPLPPLPAAAAAALPWQAERLLAGCAAAAGSAPPCCDPAAPRLHVHDPASASPAAPGDCVINLAWPPCEQLSGWIEALRPMASVLDPDPERAAFLQLFGVPAHHQPLAPLVLDPAAIEPLLRHAQLHLGLPDPRWFEPRLELAVLGSSCQARERRWGTLGLAPEASGLLLLPRLPQLVLASLRDAQALQAWLQVLAGHCHQVISLQPLAAGACEPPAALPASAELELLTGWEERFR
jgi:hypothetical protein